MSPSQSSVLGILDFPPEIRNKIYSLVLHDDEEDTLCPFVWQLSPGKRKYGYSLTQTCHQIRQETLTMWHAGKKILFAMRPDNMAGYKNWLARRPDAAFSSIRRIQLEDYQQTGSRNGLMMHSSSCRSVVNINLSKSSPVSWNRDRRCFDCPLHDTASDRVKAVVRTLKKDRGVAVLTREKLEDIFEAAAWNL